MPDATVIPTAPARDPETGRFLPGNFEAIQHALRTDRLPAEFAHLAAEIDAFASASIADDGGETEIGVRRQAHHGYRARIHRRIVQLDAALELRGLFDKRGKLRVAWLQQLQALINTAKGIDSLLGLERRSRDITGMSAEEYARRQAQESQP